MTADASGNIHLLDGEGILIGNMIEVKEEERTLHVYMANRSSLHSPITKMYLHTADHSHYQVVVEY